MVKNNDLSIQLVHGIPGIEMFSDWDGLGINVEIKFWELELLIAV